MLTVKVDLSSNSYDILIGNKVLPELGAAVKALGLGTDAVIITNPVVKNHHGRAVTASLKQAGLTSTALEVPDGEASKSFASACELIEKIAAYDVGKDLFVVALGGGVIGDLAGFVAAIYKRGVPYIQIPTTLLAQVDSSIGGKVAIDLPVGKNLVGAFYQPRMVFSDMATLTTLDRRQIINGLAEVVKYAVICDKKFFEFLEKNVAKLLELEPKVFTEVIATCSRFKARIVASDERETKGVRTILNFGHTTGHAIEAANQFRDYQHGEAVALGMRVAVEISQQLGLIQPDGVERINRLLSQLGLPERIEHVTVAEIMTHMRHDKKFKGKKNKFVLTTGMGGVKVVEGVDPTVIEAAVAKLV